MTRPGRKQLWIDPDIAKLVEQAARDWGAELRRDVPTKLAAEKLILTGLKHAAEAKKLLP